MSKCRPRWLRSSSEVNSQTVSNFAVSTDGKILISGKLELHKQVYKIHFQKPDYVLSSEVASCSVSKAMCMILVFELLALS